MAAVETVREAVPQAVFPRLQEQLHVSHRNRDQPGRDAERLPLIAGDRGPVLDPEDADGHAAGDQRKTEDVALDDTREARIVEGLRRVRAIRKRLELLQRSAVGRALQEYLPAVGSPRQHPACALAGERRQVPPQRLLERRGVQRVRQGLAEGHQPLELRRAQAALSRLGGSDDRVGLRLLPLAEVMEEKDPGKNNQRRKQIDVVALLHVPRGLPDKAERPLKYHDGAGDEAGDERRVISGDEAHGSPGLKLQSPAYSSRLREACAIGNTPRRRGMSRSAPGQGPARRPAA